VSEGDRETSIMGKPSPLGAVVPLKKRYVWRKVCVRKRWHCEKLDDRYVLLGCKIECIICRLLISAPLSIFPSVCNLVSTVKQFLVFP